MVLYEIGKIIISKKNDEIKQKKEEKEKRALKFAQPRGRGRLK